MSRNLTPSERSKTASGRLKPRWGKRSLNHPTNIAAQQRRIEFVKLWLTGMPQVEIAARFGIANSTVCEGIKKAMLAAGKEDILEARGRWNARSERAYEKLAPLFELPDPAVVTSATLALTRLDKRAAERNGSDAPPRAPVDEDGKTVRFSVADIRLILDDADA